MQFSATACIRHGWQTFKTRGWFLVGVTALVIVASWLIGVIAAAFGENNASGLVGVIVHIGFSTLLSMGFVATFIRAHDTIESAEVNDLWHPQPFLKFLAAELLVGLVTVAGLILFIVPGIIFMLMYLFVPYLVIDREIGPIVAMKESARITWGLRWELLLLVLLVFVLNVAGAIALLAGLLISIPVTTLALVHAYRALESKARQSTAP